MKKSKFILAAAAILCAVIARGAPASDGICPVHKIKMEAVELKLVYGMPSPKEFEEMRVAKKKFPYGKDYALAGCVVKPKKTIDGFLCPQCVRAREKWLKAHRKESARE